MDSAFLRAVVLCLGMLPTGWAIALEGTTGERRDELEVYSDLQLFGEIFDHIRADYVDAPDEQELIRAAIQGMLTSLDPHSGYLPPAQSAEFQQDISGEFGGLGLEVTMENEVAPGPPRDPAAMAGSSGGKERKPP